MKYLNLFIFCLLLFNSCKKEESDDLPANFEGYSYFPLNVGDVWVYQVDSIVYDDFTQEVDSFSFQLREEIESTFNDGSNRKAFIVRVSIRESDTLDWKFIRTITKLRTDLRAEVQDNNFTTIPLVFPTVQSSSWDINILNIEEELIANFERLHLTFENYDSTISVVQEPDISLIERRTSREVYASNIGLVKVEREDVQLDFSSGEIQSGFILNKDLISYN